MTFVQACLISQELELVSQPLSPGRQPSAAAAAGHPSLTAALQPQQAFAVHLAVAPHAAAWRSMPVRLQTCFRAVPCNLNVKVTTQTLNLCTFLHDCSGNYLVLR